MDGSLRPAGIALSLVGNLLIAFGMGGLIAEINAVGTDDSRALVLASARPAAMLAFGYVMVRFAPRFGGGSLGMQFLLIGATSLWGAIHATTGADRIVGYMIGSVFLIVAAVGLVGIAMVYGWKHSLTHPAPVVLRRGGVPQPLTVANFAEALREAASAKGTAFATNPLTPQQRAEAMRQIEQLQASGKLTPEQVEAIKTWWG